MTSELPYPFDGENRDYVAELLYRLLPALYRTRDEAPLGRGELAAFLRVLAAPLAEVRQSVEELHGDLFIDTAHAWVIPYLAEMVGTTLLFPDAESNRRDVRGTVAWRRRKGTRRTLEEMGSELADQIVVTQEGWKRVLLAQDLNLLREERTITELAPAIVAEIGSGPLDRLYHALDPRPTTLTTGRYHPRDVVHWTHPTQLFPLRDGTAFDRTPRDGLGVPTVQDLRYTFHPLGLEMELRARRTSADDPLPTDRIPPMHFADAPGDYFGVDGRFEVRLLGLLGGVAKSESSRSATRRGADPLLVADATAFTVLEHAAPTDEVAIELFAVPRVGPVQDVPDTSSAQIQSRGGATIGSAGVAPIAGVNAPLADAVAMIRLRPTAQGAYFRGATVQLSAGVLGARMASTESELAREGFLRGSIFVHVPEGWVWRDPLRAESGRWFYVAADGSLYSAQSTAAHRSAAEADVVVTPPVNAAIGFAGEPVVVGPGAAWPPILPRASERRSRSMPHAFGRGPRIVHGGPAVTQPAPNTFALAPGGATLALVFAARPSPTQIEPFLRLSWQGSDPTSASAWSALESNGTECANLAAMDARLEAIAALRDGGPVELLVRFEASVAGVILPPCEVAYASDRGESMLIHLPELRALPGAPGIWGPSANMNAVSVAMIAGEDGASWTDGGQEVARLSHGPILPLSAPAPLRRRRVRERKLCPWRNEQLPAIVHAPTPPGFLDVDPPHGLFAISASEPAPAYTRSILFPLAWIPPSAVTVGYQDGYSAHIGARPASRQRLLTTRLPAPTRIVSGSGHFRRDAGSEVYTVPRYATLGAALLDIAANPAADEVVQLEDSATYDGLLSWPAPAGLRSLQIQAAENERPMIRLSADWLANLGAGFTRLIIRGVAIAGPAGGAIVRFPACEELELDFVTAARGRDRWVFQVPATGAHLIVHRSLTAALQLIGAAELTIEDSVIDADLQGSPNVRALSALEGTVSIERATVSATIDANRVTPVTEVLVLEASEVLFTNDVRALDRFRGCVRYSRAGAGSQLPRQHRVIIEDPAKRETYPHFVSRDRDDPAHLRLAADCPKGILRGAEDGSEMGAFHDTRTAQRLEALIRRLLEFTPAGLATGFVRLD